jgi:hypothetical protein
VLCLYPGVYSAGLPLSLDPAGDDDSIQFLGHKMTPSGAQPDDNAYILNVKVKLGGYLDGQALNVHTDVERRSAPGIDQALLTTQSGRRLDENPSACAQLVNHSSNHSNVAVVPFLWDDILDSDRCQSHDYYTLPNVLRSDGFPRYICGTEITYYQGSVGQVAGAAFVASQNIRSGEELCLNYALHRRPLPAWAANWYDSA